MNELNKKPIRANKFKVITDPSQRDTYIDGVSGIMFGPSVARMQCHQVQDVNDNEGEIRKIVQTLVIPTPALLELCLNVLANVGSNMDQLVGARQAEILESVEKIRKFAATGIKPSTPSN